MTSTSRILIVAHRTATSAPLLNAVRERAQQGQCEFTLLIPDSPNRTSGQAALEHALPILTDAAGGHVEGIAAGPDPVDAVTWTVSDGGYDEIVISMLPRRFSRWRRRDLVEWAMTLGLPVTAVAPDDYTPTGPGVWATEDEPVYVGH